MGSTNRDGTRRRERAKPAVFIIIISDEIQSKSSEVWKISAGERVCVWEDKGRLQANLGGGSWKCLQYICVCVSVSERDKCIKTDLVKAEGRTNEPEMQLHAQIRARTSKYDAPVQV